MFAHGWFVTQQNQRTYIYSPCNPPPPLPVIGVPMTYTHYATHALKVIHALWEELQERHGQGVYCMLRKGLQNALLVRLARPLNGGRMSKNKVNKIFQVLIRSCFVLHSRGGHRDDDRDGFSCHHEPGEDRTGLLLSAGFFFFRFALSSLQGQLPLPQDLELGNKKDRTRAKR